MQPDQRQRITEYHRPSSLQEYGWLHCRNSAEVANIPHKGETANSSCKENFREQLSWRNQGVAQQMHCPYLGLQDRKRSDIALKTLQHQKKNHKTSLNIYSKFQTTPRYCWLILDYTSIGFLVHTAYLLFFGYIHLFNSFYFFSLNQTVPLGSKLPAEARVRAWSCGTGLRLLGQ